jgi:hypothetical protein
MNVDELLKYEVIFRNFFFKFLPKFLLIIFILKPEKPIGSNSRRLEDGAFQSLQKKLKTDSLDHLNEKEKLEVLKMLENEPEVRI